MLKKLIEFINKPTLFCEILRFVIVGGIATVVDFLIMGVTLYIFDPSLYPHFYNVFYGGGEPSLAAKLVGTGVGFIVGLIANYVLSVVFVFNEKGRSRTLKGFLVFSIFSAIGLFIHELGMYLLSDVWSVNEWICKILLTFVVLFYNYVSRKIFIFKDPENGEGAIENEENDTEEHINET